MAFFPYYIVTAFGDLLTYFCFIAFPLRDLPLAVRLGKGLSKHPVRRFGTARKRNGDMIGKKETSILPLVAHPLSHFSAWAVKCVWWRYGEMFRGLFVDSFSCSVMGSIFGDIVWV